VAQLAAPLAAMARAWIAYAAAMVVFCLLCVAIVYQQNATEEALARTAANQQLHLLSLAIQGELDRSQYRSAAELIEEWGGSSPQVAELSLTGQSGETIAAFRRAEPAAEGLRLSTALDYSYAGRAIIKLHYDLGPTCWRRSRQRRWST
jgi:hypothetical protein